MIGATTENPSFQLNNALLSRCRVIVLEKLTTDHVEQILRNAVDSMGLSTSMGSLPGIRNKDLLTAEYRSDLHASVAIEFQVNFFILLYFELRVNHFNLQNFHIGGISGMNTISLVVGASRVIIMI